MSVSPISNSPVEGSHSDKNRYHHGNLREALLEAAFTHLVEQGVESMSLRALARSIGVSQSAPYRHFPDKKHLLAAMAAQGINEMYLAIEKATDGVEKPDEALLISAESGIQFAMANPEQYRLIFGPYACEFRDFPEVKAARERIIGTLVDLFRGGQALGVFSNEPPWFLACNAWANMHGHAMLILDDLVSCVVPEGETLDIKRSIQMNMFGRLISTEKQ